MIKKYLVKHRRMRKDIRKLFEAGRLGVFHFAPSIEKTAETLRLLAQFRAVAAAEFTPRRRISNYF